MLLEARREGKPLPTQHEINKAANFLWGIRAFSSWASPVQMEFAPKHQYWLDEAHRYRELYGQNYFDKFLADKGQAAAYYAISSSNSAVARSGSRARTTAPITAIASAPAARTSRAVSVVMPPIATSGRLTRARTSASRWQPITGSAVALLVVTNIGPRAR